jgi:16S rRNA (guanine966-N2)-methyltransferase
MLMPDVPGSYFLDLFAGSGQIGLEALSRGALYSVFVDNDRNACACIEDNILFTRFDKQSLLMKQDVFGALRMMEGKYKFDIIFMDPPYDKGLEREVIEYLSSSSLLKPDTLIVAEGSLATDFSYLDDLGFAMRKLKKYKTNEHAFIVQKGTLEE